MDSGIMFKLPDFSYEMARFNPQRPPSAEVLDRLTSLFNRGELTTSDEQWNGKGIRAIVLATKSGVGFYPQAHYIGEKLVAVSVFSIEDEAVYFLAENDFIGQIFFAARSFREAVVGAKILLGPLRDGKNPVGGFGNSGRAKFHYGNLVEVAAVQLN